MSTLKRSYFKSSKVQQRYYDQYVNDANHILVLALKSVTDYLSCDTIGIADRNDSSEEQFVLECLLGKRHPLD